MGRRRVATHITSGKKVVGGTDWAAECRAAMMKAEKIAIVANMMAVNGQILVWEYTAGEREIGTVLVAKATREMIILSALSLFIGSNINRIKTHVISIVRKKKTVSKKHTKMLENKLKRLSGAVRNSNKMRSTAVRLKGRKMPVNLVNKKVIINIKRPAVMRRKPLRVNVLHGLHNKPSNGDGINNGVNADIDSNLDSPNKYVTEDSINAGYSEWNRRMLWRCDGVKHGGEEIGEGFFKMCVVVKMVF